MQFMDNIFHLDIEDQFNEYAEELDQYGMDKTADPINFEGYDGFMPFTNGGWGLKIMDDLDRLAGSGDQYNKKAMVQLQSAIDYSYDCALLDFIDEYRDQLEAIYGTREGENLKQVVNYHDLYDKEQGELAEKLSEDEHSALSEGGEFWVEMRAQYYAADNYRNETGEDEICFLAGINTDFGYGRDKGLVETFERTVKVSDLDDDKLKEIIQEMRNSLD